MLHLGAGGYGGLMAAIGVLTMKGLVEAFGDPLKYTDAELVSGLEDIFRTVSDAGRRRRPE